MVELEGRLPAVIRGDDKPKDAAEKLEFAKFASNTKQFGSSARLYAEAFQADPKLAEDVKPENRYEAASSAALAAAGKGNDKLPLDEPEKARWRKQALDWLRADLAHWTKQVETGKPEAKELVSQKLRKWKADADLAGIREPDGLAKLPESEQTEWRALWADVEALLKRTEG
jgi:serine/threonine-protein kinase